MANPLQRLTTWLTEPLETRTVSLQQRSDSLDPDADYADIDTQLYRRQRARAGDTARPTIRQALSVPAIFRAVNLLSSTAATLPLKEYVQQREVNAAPVVRRPQPEWKPADFWRDTVLYKATRGEFIWLVLARDSAGFATSLLPVPPETMQSKWDGIRHKWWTIVDSKVVNFDSRDVVHDVMVRDPATGRGLGPLQLCGVAANVAVEAEWWASRFFVGAMPSVYLDSRAPLGAGDVDVIREKWLNSPPNTPKVGHGLTPTLLQNDPEAAQLTQSRMHSRGEAALMFGISGRLLEYAESGSSITYANAGDLATELVRLTLAPNYLEPMEQAFSDLRPRGTECRFDVSEMERADPKTRYAIHKLAIDAGVYTPEYAAQQEGITGGAPSVVPSPLRVING